MRRTPTAIATMLTTGRYLRIAVVHYIVLAWQQCPPIKLDLLQPLRT
jgi:hypothetical protein